MTALIRALVLVFVGLFAVPAQASADIGRSAPTRLANLFESDDRQRWPRTPGTPAGGIVLIVDPTTDKAGTGFLIAPCYAMSALHVVLSDFDLTARRYPNVRYEYTIYYGRGNRFGSFENFTVARPLAWGRYFESITVDASEDWILLQLEECIGRDYGYFRFAVLGIDEARAEPRLALAGYPGTEHETVQADPLCRIRAERDWPEAGGPLWYHDCATRRGISGGPIFRHTEEGHEAVAIAVGELQPMERLRLSYSEAYANVAVPIGNAGWALTAVHGESRELIAEAQRLLEALGRGAGRIDGIADARTRMAIAGYRTVRRLDGAGLVTEALITRLRREVESRPGPQP
ncbi:MAG: hypothetical protein GVY13_05660 [Alphaproteobacteria bacterium]|jgi:V8-like Glu-specific endopeptidase|nr:hypothetical protein [Alphaproteobacteria bacterium]